VTNLKVCSQKIVPIFLFFLFGPGNLNYDKIFERGTTQLWVILIMGRENYYRTLCQRALWDLSKGNLKSRRPQGLRVILLMTSLKGAGKYFLVVNIQNKEGLRGTIAKASLNLKRALWGDKPEGLLPENCPNFSFFLFGPGNLNYDKIFERGTTRLCVILIMSRENYYRTLCQRAREI
jgi:hypothetical protein